MPYAPPKWPTVASLEELQRLAEAEFANLAGDLAETTEVELRPSGAIPKKPRTGLIVYADGIAWNPGAGEGVYVFTSAGVWSKL